MVPLLLEGLGLLVVVPQLFVLGCVLLHVEVLGKDGGWWFRFRFHALILWTAKTNH